MKKTLQFGLSLALAALISTGIVFAGDGDGKKTSISVKSGGATDITLNVQCTNYDLSEINIVARNGGDIVIHDITEMEGGFAVNVSFYPGSSSYGHNDDDVIWEIVGVDNITGIAGNDDETPITVQLLPGETVDNNVNSNPTNGMVSPTEGNNGSVPAITPGISNFDITIYPNPITTETNVVTVGEILGKTINVMDMTGKMVLNLNLGGKNRTTLDLSDLQPGIYILNFTTTDGKTISKRIQKI